MSAEDLDTYDLDLSDDPFDEEPARPTSPTGANSKKRKDPDSLLGLDEEIAITKRARGPTVKLDESRLLSDTGIPKLRRTAASKLKFKGRGHEFGDAARLLEFYQMWLDDLFPKARFLDALTMVEKVGHKKTMIRARMEWIKEGRRAEVREGMGDHFDPFDLGDDSVGKLDPSREQARDPAGPSMAGLDPRSKDSPVPLKNGGLPTTPRQGSVPPSDEEIFDATPNTQPLRSIFGIPRPPAAAETTRDNDMPDDEDLDALMAMEEAERAGKTTISGRRSQVPPIVNTVKQNHTEPVPQDDFGDAEAAMAEMDAW